MDGPYSSSFLPFFLAAGITTLCCLFAVLSLRFDSKKFNRSCGCDCSCDRRNGGGEMLAAAAAAERQVGGSMMEQLVPEITTHALSYLDCMSLCRLSMTNSAMRRAANDDGAWKALYRKDFNGEQNGITPVNGWKSYYAATKAILSVNAEFYNIIRGRSLAGMSHFWLNADYVKCIHGSGELFTGHTAVIESWALAFNWMEDQGWQGVLFEIRDVRARVTGDMAWVNLKAFVDPVSGPFNMSNVYEFHNGRWYMVLHHSSIKLEDGDPVQNNIFA